jgi:hypothetical protein
MRSVLRSFLALFALGGAVSSCNKPETPIVPTDVTLAVPAMN